MPRLSRIAIRLSLAYLVVRSTFGALLLTNEGIPFAPTMWALLPAHIDIMFLGWMTQFALGVAPRGDERWSWAGFSLLNIGIRLSALSTFLSLGPTLLGARILEMMGCCFSGLETGGECIS